MNIFEVANGIVLMFGVPTIAGLLIFVGKKLNTISFLERELKEYIKPDIKYIQEKLDFLEGKLGLKNKHN